MNVSSVILAGGESRRMGRDKAWLETQPGGLPLLARAIETVRAAGISELFISGRAGVDYSRFNCPVLTDSIRNFGPMAGIERALDATKSPLLLVLAVDLPRITAPFLQRLISACTPDRGVVPALADGLEPLAAIYPKRSHPIAHDFLTTDRRVMRDFAQTCADQGYVHLLPIPPEESSVFENWNSPSDLHR